MTISDCVSVTSGRGVFAASVTVPAPRLGNSTAFDRAPGLCQATAMQCPLCRRRSARRACPALDRKICPVCCATKRQGEIACPEDCGYLADAQAHPAAVVRRQQERDFSFLNGLMHGLSSAQQELAWGVLGFVLRFDTDPLLRLKDEDVADMARALGATYDTAARGLIYESRPGSLLAQRLWTDLRTQLDQGQEQGGRAFERDASAVLARVAQGFGSSAEPWRPEGPTGCLAAAARVLQAAQAAASAEAAQGGRIESPSPTLIRP